MLLEFKFRLNSTKEQEVRLNQIAGSCRWVWSVLCDLNYEGSYVLWGVVVHNQRNSVTNLLISKFVFHNPIFVKTRAQP